MTRISSDHRKAVRVLAREGWHPARIALVLGISLSTVRRTIEAIECHKGTVRRVAERVGVA